jgi:hypothetical protein
VALGLSVLTAESVVETVDERVGSFDKEGVADTVPERLRSGEELLLTDTVDDLLIVDDVEDIIVADDDSQEVLELDELSDGELDSELVFVKNRLDSELHGLDEGLPD